MGLFDKFLKPKKNTPPPTQQASLFGRFSDAYRTLERQTYWNKAVDFFEKKKYQASIKAFLDYLSDKNLKNVTYTVEESTINFEILQGSKKIIGKVNGVMVEIEVKVAKCRQLSVGFMKRLMEKNYQLKYGRFALDTENNISMKFETHLLDASPYKLYEAFKEVATNTDKLDDLLIDEYEELTSMDIGHLKDASPQEKEVKYQFIKEEINKTLAIVKSLDETKVASGFAFLLLNLTYKIDYLTKPEGYMMEVLERMHRIYFAHDHRTISAKCELLVEELEDILKRSEDDIKKEFYQVVSTFGITGRVTHERVQSFIDGELPAMDWFLKNDYQQIALAIPGYIIGYCLFNFTLPQPDRELFHLYYEITEPQYFKNLGYSNNYYDLTTQKMNKTAIKNGIQDIIKNNKTLYPYMVPDLSELVFISLPLFAKSYLTMIADLDMTAK